SQVGKEYKSIFVPVNNTKEVGDWTADYYKLENENDTMHINHILQLLEDDVYLPDEKQREEYILNDFGEIYQGSAEQINTKPWKFGQFNKYMLPTITFLLESYGLSYEQLSNATLISRAISSVTNANDISETRRGIIVGNWGDNFEPYAPPGYWKGSVEIIKQFYESHFRPVRYGQCWVFACTATSLARAIGLPARPVTCFGSRHDADESLTIDTFFDEDGEPIESMNGIEMAWNFHAWTEVWMKRTDLPNGYGGWQAIDATPQERSDGLSQAGPVSLFAVRTGEISKKFDTAFAYGEVDGILVHWHRNKSSDLGWTRVVPLNIPTTIYTKGIGQFSEDENSLVDVTNNYKYPEGSIERQMARLKARQNRGLKFVFGDSAVIELVDFNLTADRVMIGEPFKVKLEISNKNNRVVKISSMLNVKSTHYNGGIAADIVKNRNDFSIASNGSVTHEITVVADEYLHKLVPFNSIKIYAIVMVESEKIWSQEKSFVISQPRLNMSVSGHMRVGEVVLLNVSFTNPLNKQLTNSVLSIEAGDVQIIKEFGNIGAKQTFSYIASVRLTKAEYETIVASFDSSELKDIHGYLTMAVSNND
ncbi:Hemocyte protein-glutamine gamma-glutamyltransferase-like protein, partial [Dinothrombium tinctorium]